MKQRIISALVALIIVIPLLVLGGIYFKVLVGILGLIGLWELLRIKPIDEAIKYISYIMFILLLYTTNNIINLIYISILFVMLVYCHDDSKYNIEDLLYTYASTFILSLLFNNFILVRDIGINTTIYLILISTMTDTFALVFGMKYGKNKLCESISPNKTIEGAIFGSIFSTLIANIFYVLFVGSADLSIIVLTLILSIVGQVGDLVFSSIKRHFKIKDFSNIMPGHGGVLDRLDSLLFIVCVYFVLISI